MAEGTYDYWWCVADVPIRADLQVRDTKINVPETANLVHINNLPQEAAPIGGAASLFAKLPPAIK